MEAIIDALLNAGRPSDPAVIRHFVLQQFATDPPIIGRRAVLLASTMASAYIRRFAPEARWRLIGRNLPIGRGRADLLFTDGQRWFVDELKAARIRPHDQPLIDQVAVYQEGRQTYGDAFLGVRVALLRAPSQLLIFPAPGAAEPLPTERPR
jgi:hypothetical protein